MRPPRRPSHGRQVRVHLLPATTPSSSSSSTATSRWMPPRGSGGLEPQERVRNPFNPNLGHGYGSYSILLFAQIQPCTAVQTDAPEQPFWFLSWLFFLGVVGMAWDWISSDPKIHTHTSHRSVAPKIKHKQKQYKRVSTHESQFSRVAFAARKAKNKRLPRTHKIPTQVEQPSQKTIACLACRTSQQKTHTASPM